MLLYSVYSTHLTLCIEQMFNKYSGWNGLIQKCENALVEVCLF